MPNEHDFTQPPADSGNPEDADILEPALSCREAATVAGVDYDYLLGAVKMGDVEATKIGPYYILTRETVLALRARHAARAGA